MIYIIADDLTGACDTGACFAQRGLSVAVQVGRPAESTPPNSTCDVLVFNTESRALTESQATKAVRDVATIVGAGLAPARIVGRPQGIAPTQPTTWVYKKIDSTLRGHPGAELHALMDALHVERALVTPAFPAQGRTVVNGQLLVHGQPLSQTVFAGEGALGDLHSVFAHAHLALHTLTLDDLRQGPPTQGLREPGIFLADAQTDGDLRELARLARECGIRLLCGSAGLATALADELGPTRTEPTTSASATGPILIAAGSMNPATMGQVRYAQAQGIAVFQPMLDKMDEATNESTNKRMTQTPFVYSLTFVDSLVSVLSHDGRAILTTCGLPESPLGRGGMAQALGAVVAQVASRIALGALVLTGGDIATAVCNSLGASWLALCGEAQPGIALGQLADGPYAGVRIITKAGGFGGEDALMACLRQAI